MADLHNDYEIFSAVWKFYKKFFAVEGSDEYWDAEIEAARKLNQRYGNAPLCRRLVLAVSCELERRLKTEAQS